MDSAEPKQLRMPKEGTQMRHARSNPRCTQPCRLSADLRPATPAQTQVASWCAVCRNTRILRLGVVWDCHNRELGMNNITS